MVWDIRYFPSPIVWDVWYSSFNSARCFLYSLRRRRKLQSEKFLASYKKNKVIRIVVDFFMAVEVLTILEIRGEYFCPMAVHLIYQNFLIWGEKFYPLFHMMLRKCYDNTRCEYSESKSEAIQSTFSPWQTYYVTRKATGTWRKTFNAIANIIEFWYVLSIYQNSDVYFIYQNFTYFYQNLLN